MYGLPPRARDLAYWFPSDFCSSAEKDESALVNLPDAALDTLYAFLDVSGLEHLGQTCRRFAPECLGLRRWQGYVAAAQNASEYTWFDLHEERPFFPQDEQDQHAYQRDGYLPHPQAVDYPVLCARAVSHHHANTLARYFVRISDQKHVYFQDFLSAKTKNRDRRRQQFLYFPQTAIPPEGISGSNVVVTVLFATRRGPRLVHCSRLALRPHRWTGLWGGDHDGWTGLWGGDHVRDSFSAPTLTQNVLPRRNNPDGYAQHIGSQLRVQRQEEDGAFCLNCLRLEFYVNEFSSGGRPSLTDDGEYEYYADSDSDFIIKDSDFIIKEPNDPLHLWLEGYESEGDEYSVEDGTERQARRRTHAGTRKHKHRRRPLRRTKLMVPRKQRRNGNNGRVL